MGKSIDFHSFVNFLLNGDTSALYALDHGPRNDEIRNTPIGRVEERMPLLSIIIPEHIKRKYPHLEENLQTNENQLTSPYDLHETLMGKIVVY
jgi:hypothetical protein